MKVGRIAHAGIVVGTRRSRMFMDPIFEPDIQRGANVFAPAIRVDAPPLVKGATAIVLSHSHRDHFSPRSLTQFDRSTPVIYPAGDAAIETTLSRLGFKGGVAVSIGDTLEVGDITLIPTPSRVDFPEMGMAFQAEGAVVWNLVDTHVDEQIVGEVRRAIGRPDLLLAPFQPLIDLPLWSNGLGADFPFKAYTAMLKTVWMTRPRRVVPFACGYKYRRAWLNDRGFPIDEVQFGKDVRKVDAAIAVTHMPCGSVIDLAKNCALDPNGLIGVTRVDPASTHTRYEWRPDRAVPALEDTNPYALPMHRLRREVTAFVDRKLLVEVSGFDPAWLERMAALDAIWTLEVVFPDGARLARHLDFTVSPLKWLPRSASPFAKILTVVTASGLVGVLNGYHSEHSYWLNEFRTSHRLYAVHAHGVLEGGNQFDDPLFKAVSIGADDRYLAAELDQLDRELAAKRADESRHIKGQRMSARSVRAVRRRA